MAGVGSSSSSSREENTSKTSQSSGPPEREELDTFKFELEKSEGKVIGNSVGREATIRQLPISVGLAGVSMQLEPGVMRELHWHATAAEWAFVIKGRVRTTVIDPNGCSETNDYWPGDVWYFPRGHAHMIECLGNEASHFILIFDNGHFSEFGTFSISDWFAHTPKEILAKNLGLPVSAFDDFPDHEVYFAKGDIPSDEQATPVHGWKLPPTSHKYQMLKQPPHREFKGGREWRVDSSSFPISTTMTGVVLDLEPGALRELHWHPTSDEWQYLIEGQTSVTMFGSGGRYRIETLNKGDVAYIPQGYGHSIENIGSTPCRVLIGFNTGTYATIDLSQWLGGNPLDVLATNFSKPASLFKGLPKKDVFVADKDGK